MEENQLIEQIIGGNTHAFRFLVKKYERLVFHIVGRLIDQQADIEDISQNVFVKVYKKLPEFRGASKLSTWIGTIAYREAIDFLKKNKRAFQGLENLNLTDSLTLVETNHPENIRTKAERVALIKSLIVELPPVYRTILSLYHIEELSYKEIEKITDMPEGTLKSYLHRARQLLKSQLLKHPTFVEEWL
ncbi:MAG: sigma-70 family RNA polymerase sigma factor [Bacteroidales bacterium]|nr:sigma-70 family RNA polymerase sigma factor [Bacteroidales bacterium]